MSHRIEMTLDFTISTTTDSGKADLVWDPQDPAALRVTFTIQGESVEWVFARELASSGARVALPVGQCDVKVCGYDLTRVRLHLSSPEGEADVLLPVVGLEAFLAKTERHTASYSLAEDQVIEGRIDQVINAIMFESESGN